MGRNFYNCESNEDLFQTIINQLNDAACQTASLKDLLKTARSIEIPKLSINTYRITCHPPPPSFSDSNVDIPKEDDFGNGDGDNTDNNDNEDIDNSLCDIDIDNADNDNDNDSNHLDDTVEEVTIKPITQQEVISNNILFIAVHKRQIIMNKENKRVATQRWAYLVETDKGNLIWILEENAVFRENYILLAKYEARAYNIFDFLGISFVTRKGLALSSYKRIIQLSKVSQPFVVSSDNPPPTLSLSDSEQTQSSPSPMKKKAATQEGIKKFLLTSTSPRPAPQQSTKKRRISPWKVVEREQRTSLVAKSQNESESSNDNGNDNDSDREDSDDNDNNNNNDNGNDNDSDNGYQETNNTTFSLPERPYYPISSFRSSSRREAALNWAKRKNLI